jgi:hypothetical protein
MSICLCCEFLERIGDAMSIFKHECSGLSGDIQSLGEQLIDSMNGDFVPTIFMDTDFLDRTVLKLIT